MIVCSCNRISEIEIRDMARIGATTTEAAYAALGCEAQCGCCVDYAQELIDEALATKRPQLRLISTRAA